MAGTYYRPNIASNAGTLAILLFLSMSISAVAGPSTAPATRRLAAPSPSQLRTAEKQVDELTNATTPFASTNAATRLLDASRATSADPALRYAAATRAMDLSAGARDTETAMAALADLTDSFDIDPTDLQTRLIVQLARAKAPNPAATLAIRYLDDALAANHPPAADRFVTMLRNLRIDVRPEVQTAIDTALDDHAYARRLGPGAPFNCLYMGDWQTNLSALSQSDSPYAAAAKADISATDLPGHLNAAEIWWNLAQSHQGKVAWRIQSRAIQIYEPLIPKLEGLQQQLVLTRLATHQRAGLPYRAILPGLLRTSWREASPLTNRVPATQPYLDRDAEDSLIAKKDAHVRFQGMLLIDVPGVYELIFEAGTSLCVSVDGKQVINDPKASRKRSGEKVPLKLASGLHAIVIEVSAASSRPRLETHWKTPLSGDDVPIPTEALFHDGLLAP